MHGEQPLRPLCQPENYQAAGQGFSKLSHLQILWMLFSRILVSSWESSPLFTEASCLARGFSETSRTCTCRRPCCCCASHPIAGSTWQG